MPQSSRADSNKPLIADLSFLMPNAAPVLVPSHEYVQEIEVQTFSDGGWKGRLVLFDADGDFLENLILVAGTDAKVSFRFGFDTGQMADNPLHKGSVVKYTPDFNPQGTTLDIEIVATQSLEAVLDQTIRSFPAGMTATAIFREIAKARNWQLRDRFGNSTVEETVGAYPEMPYIDESDVRFIKERLLPEAVNAEKHGFVFFFDVDGAAHFHSINKTSATNGASYTLAKSYVYARDAWGEVLSFKPTDDVIASYLYGGGNVQYTGVDSEGGTANEKSAQALNGPDGVLLTGKAGALFRPTVGKGSAAKIHFTTRDAEELDRLVSSRWTKMAAAAYTAEMEVLGTHAIRPEDYVQVRYLKKNGGDHYLSGVFQVSEVTQRWGSAGWTTGLKMARLGHNFTDASERIAIKKSAVVVTGATTGESGGVSNTTVQDGTGQSRRPGVTQ